MEQHTIMEEPALTANRIVRTHHDHQAQEVCRVGERGVMVVRISAARRTQQRIVKDEASLNLEEISDLIEQAASLCASRTPSPPGALAGRCRTGSSTANRSCSNVVSEEPIPRECGICFEAMLYPLHVMRCGLCRAVFCFDCIKWYIQLKISAGEVSRKKMVCAAPQCSRPLEQDEVQRYVTTDSFAKYLKFLENQEQGIRFCPRPGCCAMLHESRFSKERHVKCTTCEQESCMRCGKAYHKLPFCRRMDRRYKKWRNNHNVRPCPNCRTDIEKQGGCSHMRCFHCDQEFCWECQRDWRKHNESLCLPLAFLHSRDPRFGCWMPLRFVTKTIIAGGVAAVVITGIGVAIVVAGAGLGCIVVGMPLCFGIERFNSWYWRWKRSRHPELLVLCVPSAEDLAALSSRRLQT